MFLVTGMSSNDNHRWAHMMPMACNICTCNVFATSSFNFCLPTYFVSHYCCRRALPYMQCPIEEFLNKKVKQSCLKWYGKCNAKVTHTVQYVGVHDETWCRFPFRRLPYTSIFLSVLFLETDVLHWSLSLFILFLYLTFWHHMIQNRDSQA